MTTRREFLELVGRMGLGALFGFGLKKAVRKPDLDTAGLSEMIDLFRTLPGLRGFWPMSGFNEDAVSSDASRPSLSTSDCHREDAVNYFVSTSVSTSTSSDACHSASSCDCRGNCDACDDCTACYDTTVVWKLRS